MKKKQNKAGFERGTSVNGTLPKAPLSKGAVMLALFLSGHLKAQNGVSIGIPRPDQSAILHIQSDAIPKGIIIPRYTTNDRDRIDMANTDDPRGLIVYNTNKNAFEYYVGNQWLTLVPSPANQDQSMADHKITSLANGTEGDHAVNYSQLTAVDNSNLNRSGNEAMTGALNMGGFKVTSLSNGTVGTDAVNFSQLEALENRLMERIDELESRLDDIGFLLKGTVSIGNVSGDKLISVTFPSDIGTSNYTVYGSFISLGNEEYDNDLGPFFVLTRTSSGFIFSVAERTPEANNVVLEYLLFRK